MAATSTATFMVCDLVGSTTRHARIGEDAADQFRARFFDAMRGAVAANGGEVIKNLGDGLLVVFRSSTVDALQCAHDLHAAVHPLDGDDPVQLRVGVSAGEAAEEDGDWFGMPVIEASRLCAAAAPATTVTSGIVRALAGSRGSHHFTALGSKELKGIPEPVELWQVDREPPRGERAVPHHFGAVTTTLRAPGDRGGLCNRRAGVGGHHSRRRRHRGRLDHWFGPDQRAATNRDRHRHHRRGHILAGGSAHHHARDDTGHRGGTHGLLAGAHRPRLRHRPDRRRRRRHRVLVAHGAGGRTGRGARSSLRGYRIPATSNAGAAPTIIDFGPTTSFADAMSAANTVVVPSRGFGLSTPGFDCAEVDQVLADGLALPSDDEGVATAAIDAVRACRDRLIGAGFDLASYNAEAAISDVTDYLVAAGVEHTFITATPNDAPVALLAADRFPGTFQGVFLQNPVDPGSSWRADPVKDTAAAFSRYVALCQADPGCAAAYPTLDDAVADAFAKIDAAPRTFDVTAAIVHLRRYPPVEPQNIRVYFDGDRLSQTIPASLQVSIIYPLLAKSLVTGGDAALPAAAGLAATAELGRFGANTAAFLSYQCAVIPRTASTAPASAVLLPEFAAAYDEQFHDWCDVWDVPLLSTEFTSPSQGRTPTFIAVGALSPAPVALYAENLLRYRSNTTVITFATMGSAIDLLGPPCYRDLLLAFVSDPDIELATEECAAQSPPIAFVL